jgi:hypothetical protein
LGKLLQIRIDLSTSKILEWKNFNSAAECSGFIFNADITEFAPHVGPYDKLDNYTTKINPIYLFIETGQKLF